MNEKIKNDIYDELAVKELIEDLIDVFINEEGITDKEAIIYAVTYELAKKGWKVYQIYDGWWANHDNEELNSFLTISITGHVNTYFNNHNN